MPRPGLSQSRAPGPIHGATRADGLDAAPAVPAGAGDGKVGAPDSPLGSQRSTHVEGSAKSLEPANGKPLVLTVEQLARARQVQNHVVLAARRHRIDPNLLNGVIWTESKFNSRARNRSGARGLMQLMPKTSRAMAKRLERRSRPYNPEFAIEAGSLLLSILIEKFDGNEELALFGYARGSGTVRAWQRRGDPMPEGVPTFIVKVRRAQAAFAAHGFPGQ
ncbi:MAG: transglycosylase SLT domain-containing protein [Nannocystaceae bacterium]